MHKPPTTTHNDGSETNIYKPPTTTYDNGLETNIYDIAKQICAEPPRAPCSFQLIMDHEVDSDIEFDLIRDFTLSCLRILFGEQVTPHDLNEQQIDLLNSYVKSVGYVLTIDIIETESEYQYKIKFDRYKPFKTNPFEHLKKYMSKE